ncbi:hypothetical protein D1007_33510 [Hordeum vulgare]|nr:hypothetical protein D1007_33510 [Hordeum vulgare]
MAPPRKPKYSVPPNWHRTAYRLHNHVVRDTSYRKSTPSRYDNSNQITKDVSAQGTERDSRAVRFSSESEDQNPSFTDLVRSDASEFLEGAETQASQEPPTQWGPEGGPSLASGPDDGNLTYPYLPTILEEPSTYFSEVAEDDPLPAIDGLRITGEAFPGKELQASGYSINGTTSCNFEVQNKPTYLVTADDVDSLLVIEVQPLDDQKRKGEIVKVYANEQRKITCGEFVEKIFVSLINIPYGHPTEFSIQSADGAEYNIKPGDNSLSRDSIVLILRLFRMKAVEKSKGRKKGIFFK